MDIEAVREELAALAHEQWSEWMKYLFSNCVENPYSGELVLPKWAVDRWRRQMNTPYAELPEDEKQSDRVEADRVLSRLGMV